MDARFDPANPSGHYFPSPERVAAEVEKALERENQGALFFIDLCARMGETYLNRVSKMPVHLTSQGEITEMTTLRMKLTPHWGRKELGR